MTWSRSAVTCWSRVASELAWSMRAISSLVDAPGAAAQLLPEWRISYRWTLGSIVGGALVSGVGWRSILWANVPIGIAAILLTQTFVPESKAEPAGRLDPPAKVLVVSTHFYAIIEGPCTGGLRSSSSRRTAELLAAVTDDGMEISDEEREALGLVADYATGNRPETSFERMTRIQQGNGSSADAERADTDLEAPEDEPEMGPHGAD